MSWFGLARIAVNVRRLAKAQERANELSEAQMNLEHPEWLRQEYYRKKIGDRPRAPRAVEFGTLNVEKINEDWALAHPEE